MPCSSLQDCMVTPQITKPPRLVRGGFHVLMPFKSGHSSMISAFILSCAFRAVFIHSVLALISISLTSLCCASFTSLLMAQQHFRNGSNHAQRSVMQGSFLIGQILCSTSIQERLSSSLRPSLATRSCSQSNAYWRARKRL